MIDKLICEIKQKKSCVCVGLDPQLEFIPDEIKSVAFNEFGLTLEGAAACFFEFNKRIIDSVYDLVAAVKPQIAMYEMLGTAGIEAYRDTIAYAKSKGLIVIGDTKRGDIGSTSSFYAMAHLGEVVLEYGGEKKSFLPFDEDFTTVNPYLGSDGIKPFTDICKESGKGIFILVKTSNPSSGEFQDRILVSCDEADKNTKTCLYEEVARKLNEWGSDLIGENGYSSVGAVVGATYPEIGEKLRGLCPAAYFLVPGYGAQGAGGKDLKEYFNSDGLGAVINSSRGIIAAYRSDKYSSYAGDFALAARRAVIDMNNDLKENIKGVLS